MNPLFSVIIPHYDIPDLLMPGSDTLKILYRVPSCPNKWRLMVVMFNKQCRRMNSSIKKIGTRY